MLLGPAEMTPPILDGTLRCPVCEFEETCRMPTDACTFFHECKGCHTLLRPTPGDCCVFCSYGSERCPMKQGSNAS